MKLDAELRVERHAGVSVVFTFALDASVTTYGRAEPIIGSIEKTFDQARKTAVAVLAEDAKGRA